MCAVLENGASASRSVAENVHVGEGGVRRSHFPIGVYRRPQNEHLGLVLSVGKSAYDFRPILKSVNLCKRLVFAGCSLAAAMVKLLRPHEGGRGETCHRGKDIVP